MFTSDGKYRKTYRHHFDKLCSEGETELPMSTLASRIETRNIPLSESQISAIKDAPDEIIDVDSFQKIITSKRAQKSMVKRFLYDVANPVISQSQKIEVRSYIDSYSWCPPPIFMILITVVQISIFLFYWNTDGSKSIWTDCSGCFVHHNHSRPGVLIFAPRLRSEAWRFCSYMFLHAGLNHLLGNVVIQIIVGVPLEVAHKVWRIGPIYLLAVTSGALLQYAIDPNSLLVGASAGVYSLIFAHVANVVLNWHEMPYRWIRVLVLSVFITFDFGGAIHRRFFDDQCDPVSHLAHIAGAVTGFFFGYFALYNVVEHKAETIIRYICLSLYALLLIVTVCFVIIREPYSKSLWIDARCQ